MIRGVARLDCIPTRRVERGKWGALYEEMATRDEHEFMPDTWAGRAINSMPDSGVTASALLIVQKQQLPNHYHSIISRNTDVA